MWTFVLCNETARLLLQYLLVIIRQIQIIKLLIFPILLLSFLGS
jgi:hypothetical protein